MTVFWARVLHTKRQWASGEVASSPTAASRTVGKGVFLPAALAQAGVHERRVTGREKGCSRELGSAVQAPPGPGPGARQGGHRTTPEPCSQCAKWRAFLTVTEVDN